MVNETAKDMTGRRLSRRFFTALGRRLAHGAKGPGVMPVSNRLAAWVGIASACIGGFLGLDTYRTDVAKKVDQRVEKTFDIIHRFNEPRLADARLRVLSYVDARRFCDVRIISRELIDNDFVTVLDFFDLTHSCVEAGLCDRMAAERFFSPYANYQWPILTKIVDDLRARDQSMRKDARFGEGMKNFALAPTEAPPCEGNF